MLLDLIRPEEPVAKKEIREVPTRSLIIRGLNTIKQSMEGTRLLGQTNSAIIACSTPVNARRIKTRRGGMRSKSPSESFGYSDKICDGSILRLEELRMDTVKVDAVRMNVMKMGAVKMSVVKTDAMRMGALRMNMVKTDAL
jgi:hypothetical protein